MRGKTQKRTIYYASSEPPKEQMIPASVASKMVEQARIAERMRIAAALKEWMADEHSPSPFRKIARAERAIIRLERGEALKSGKMPEV